METVKIRRVGNSNVVSLPRKFERLGYTTGTQAVIAEQPSGALLLVPASRLREYIRQLGREVIAENRAALDLLAEHDRRNSVGVAEADCNEEA